MMSRKNVSILISSCDNFSDCWDTYFYSFKKYWPDCQYNAFIITNHLDVHNNFVKAIKVGDDKGWSGNLLCALNQIKTQYIIYTHEDFWIKKPVDTKVITDYIKLMDLDQADYIGLYPGSEPFHSYPLDERLYILDKNTAYRTSLQVALWRKSIFEELIVEGENPWQFEIQGTIRSRLYDNRFLSVKRFYDSRKQPYHYGIDYVCTAINKGRWSRDAKKYVKSEGLKFDFSKRPNEKLWQRTYLFGKIIHAKNIFNNYKRLFVSKLFSTFKVF